MYAYLRNSSQSGLSDSDILDIRAYASRTGADSTEIGSRWGIDRTTAARIISGRTWGHVPDPKQVGNYTVYPDGRVYSKSAGRFLTTVTGRDGLTYIELRSKGKRERVAVATLVAKAFLGTKSSRVGFINGDTTDAHFTNLKVGK